ncbi:MAG: universal stress protein [Deltaproteobacteria bacterium]|nr:universal stress protein [Deltaproteobacteria bacterium]
MSYPFRRILSPIDFDDDSLAALDVAAQIARDNDGMVLLLHAVPVVVPPTGGAIYVDMYKGQEEAAREKLRELAVKGLRGVKHELLTQMGEPSGAIMSAATRHAADLIVMATHGRRGLSRVVLGSVAEMVLRNAPCPVLCVRRGDADKNLVARWMSPSPVTVAPGEKVAAVIMRMQQGNFRSAPVVENGRLVGLITDRDIRGQMGRVDTTEARVAMSESPPTVTPATPVQDAARVLFEQKLDALPVVENGRLVGVITNSDILRAFLDQDSA